MMKLKRIIFCFLACFLVLLPTACSDAPPEGTPIDFESARIFKPFKLKDLEGNERELTEFLSRTTLVAFFFPP